MIILNRIFLPVPMNKEWDKTPVLFLYDQQVILASLRISRG